MKFLNLSTGLSVSIARLSLVLALGVPGAAQSASLFSSSDRATTGKSIWSAETWTMASPSVDFSKIKGLFHFADSSPAVMVQLPSGDLVVTKNGTSVLFDSSMHEIERLPIASSAIAVATYENGLPPAGVNAYTPPSIEPQSQLQEPYAVEGNPVGKVDPDLLTAQMQQNDMIFAMVPTYNGGSPQGDDVSAVAAENEAWAKEVKAHQDRLQGARVADEAVASGGDTSSLVTTTSSYLLLKGVKPDEVQRAAGQFYSQAVAARRVRLQVLANARDRLAHIDRDEHVDDHADATAASAAQDHQTLIREKIACENCRDKGLKRVAFATAIGIFAGGAGAAGGAAVWGFAGGFGTFADEAFFTCSDVCGEFYKHAVSSSNK